MDSPYRLVVEDSPDLADLALLEDHVAAAAIAAAGVGDDQEFGIFVRDDEGQILAGISGLVWGGCCELQAMWVHSSLRGRGLARRRRTRPADGAALSSSSAPTTCSRAASMNGSATRPSASSRAGRPAARPGGTARTCEPAEQRMRLPAAACGNLG